MTQFRRIVALAAAPLVLIAAPSTAQGEPSPAVAQTAFVDRFSTQTWGDVRLVGAAALRCPAPATSCPAGSVTSRIDVDTDPSTFDSSQATLVVPPGAQVVWAGLYWSGDEAAVDGLGELRCDMTGAPTPAPQPTVPTTTPATTPAAQPSRHPWQWTWPTDRPWPVNSPWPGQFPSSWPFDPPDPSAQPTPQVTTPSPVPADVEAEDHVLFKINDGPYDAVDATSFARVSGPGRSGYQAYADVTAQLAMAPPAQLTSVALTVADLSAGPGLGCNGGWTVAMVYAYPNGPDPTYAPEYRSLSVFDGVLSMSSGGARIDLNGVAAAAEQTRLAMAWYGGGLPPSGAGLALNAQPLPAQFADAGSAPQADGLGYRSLSSPVPVGSIASGATTATLVVPAAPTAYLTGVVGVAQTVPLTTNLSVDASFAPASVAVGTVTALTVTVHNGSDLPTNGVVVRLGLPAGLAVVDAPASYVVSTGEWRTDRVAGGADATLQLRVRPAAPGSLAATAEVNAAEVADGDSPPSDSSSAQLTVSGLAEASRGHLLTGAALVFGAALVALGVGLLLGLRRPRPRFPRRPPGRAHFSGRS